MSDDVTFGILPAGAEDDWKVDAPEDYPVAPTFRAVLPSGAHWLLRRPDLITLLQQGDVPNPLIGIVQRAFDEEDAKKLRVRAAEAGRTVEEQALLEQGPEPDPDAEATDEEKMEGLQFIDLVVVAAVVAPALTHEPPENPGEKLARDGRLSVKAVSDEDRLFVFTWAQEGLEEAARFRPEGTRIDRVGDGGEVRAEAERPAGDTGHASERVAEILS